MRKRVHLTISGRVQGVCFRMAACDRAEELGVNGWVRNLPDNRVELTAEGDEEALDAFVRWCRRGPPMALVRNVEESVAEATGEFDSFEIE